MRTNDPTTAAPMLHLDRDGQVWRADDQGTHLMLDPEQLLQPRLTLAELRCQRGPVVQLVPAQDHAEVAA